MKPKRGRKSTGKPRAMRASVSLSPDIYKTLQAIATQKKVSTAWVLREAAERYVGEQWPLFATASSSGHGHV